MPAPKSEIECLAPNVIQGLDDEDGKNRRFAAWALGKRQDIRAIDSLADVLKNEADDVVRCGAPQSIIEITSKRYTGEEGILRMKLEK